MSCDHEFFPAGIVANERDQYRVIEVCRDCPKWARRPLFFGDEIPAVDAEGCP